MAAKFTPPDYFGELPKLAQDILRKAFDQIAEVIREPSISPEVETVEAILVVGPPQRVSPGTNGMRAILPPPSAANAGETFSLLIEDPLGPVRVNALPYRDAGGKDKETTVNGAATATFTVAGQVSFISNGIDRYMSSSPAAETASGSAAPLPGTTFSANTTATTRQPDNLQMTADNSIAARIAGRLVQLTAAASGVLRRSTSGALSFGLVGTDNIDDAAITEPKLATDSVTTVKVVDGNITEPKLATDSVTTVKITDDSVTNAKLADMAGTTVLGNPLGSTDSPQAIQFALDNTIIARTAGGLNILVGTTNGVLRRDGSNPLVFGLLVTGNYGDDTVSNPKLADMAANTIKANVTGGVADPVDHPLATLAGAGLDYATGAISVDFSTVTYTADEDTLTLTGLEFSVEDSGIDTLQLAASGVTNAKLANMAADTVKIRSGTIGAPTDLLVPEQSVMLRRSGGLTTRTCPDSGVLRRSGSNNIDFGTIGADNITGGAVTNVKLADVVAGTAKGRQIDGGTGAVVDLTGLEQGENLRRNSRLGMLVTPAGGGGAGGAYISSDFTTAGFADNHNVVSLQFQSEGTVVISGLPTGGEGQEVRFIIDDNNKANSTSKLVVKYSDSAEPSSANRLFGAQVRDSADGLVNPDKVYHGSFTSFTFSYSAIGASSTERWMFLGDGDNQLSNRLDIVAGDVPISDGNNILWRPPTTADVGHVLVSDSPGAGDLDDYNPTGFEDCSVLRITPATSGQLLTGMVAGFDLQEVRILNVGANQLIITDEDGASTAANRFAFSGTTSRVLAADSGLTVIYDSVSNRWRRTDG